MAQGTIDGLSRSDVLHGRRMASVSWRLLPLYFIIGGLTVAGTVFFGSRGQGLVAAFVGVFPAVTAVTFCAMYLQGGTAPVVSYAKGMLILLPPWVLYVIGMVTLTPKIGFVFALVASVGAYVVFSLLTMRLL